MGGIPHNHSSQLSPLTMHEDVQLSASVPIKEEVSWKWCVCVACAVRVYDSVMVVSVSVSASMSVSVSP